MESAGRLVMKDCPPPVPRDDEVLIKTAAATICTSDLNDIEFNPFGIKLPVIMGHEGAGVVAAAGAGVTEFFPGDAVMAHSVVPCMKCASCRRGLRHLCDDMEHLGINLGGAFAEYFTIRADRVRRKPPHVSFAAASLMEPVCVCIEAVARGNAAEGKNLLVIGDGPFGVMIANILGELYPEKLLIISGTNDFKLRRARKAERINIKNFNSYADVIGEIINKTDGEGIDSAFVCVGSAGALDAAVDVCRSRGTVCAFSAIHGKTPVDMFKVHVKELNICGSCNDMDCLDEAVGILAGGGAADVITHELPFDEYKRAFELASDKSGDALKVCLTF